MKDPTRWRDPDGGASPAIRALLTDERPPTPSSAEKARAWSTLAAQLPMVPIPPPAPPVGAAVAAGTGATAAKVTLAVVLATAAGAGVGTQILRTRSAEPHVPRHAIAKAQPQSAARATSTASRLPSTPDPAILPPPAPRRAIPIAPTPTLEQAASPHRLGRGAPSSRPSLPPADVPETPGERQRLPAAAPLPTASPFASLASPRPAVPAVPAPAEATAPAATSWPPSPSPASTLPREARAVAPASVHGVTAAPSSNDLWEGSRRLALARTALRAHDPDRALALLEHAAPGAEALAQEHEALTIEALAAKPTGRAAAVARARVFLRAYPQSPYRARIKAMLFADE